MSSLAAQDAAQPPAATQQQGGPSIPTPGRRISSAAVRADLVAQLRSLAESCGAIPDICKRRGPGEPDPTAGAQVADWEELRKRKDSDLLAAYPAAGLHPSTFVPTSQVAPLGVPSDPQAAAAAAAAAAAVVAGGLPPPGLPGLAGLPAMVPAGGQGGVVPLVPAMPTGGAGGAPERPSGVRTVGKVTKANKSKPGGRTFTSKYRGVHQTFPTRRWEAQFRRNGKPTSLGCFDHEEEAARAYDKMMLWCELHNAAGVKGGITNFDPSEYESDMAFLQQCTQDELVQLLRSDGRRQAAQRMLKQKRDGAAAYHAADSDDE